MVAHVWVTPTNMDTMRDVHVIHYILVGIGERGAMFEEQVARGAAWLDQVYPGWERRIDLSSLDLASGCLCILGQVVDKADTCLLNHMPDTRTSMNGFEVVARNTSRLFLTEHGFDLRGPNSRAGWAPVSQWKALQDTWVNLIKERFDSGLLSDLDD